MIWLIRISAFATAVLATMIAFRFLHFAGEGWRACAFIGACAFTAWIGRTDLGLFVTQRQSALLSWTMFLVIIAGSFLERWAR